MQPPLWRSPVSVDHAGGKDFGLSFFQAMKIPRENNGDRNLLVIGDNS
jgi:hypothetical protein